MLLRESWYFGDCILTFYIILDSLNFISGQSLVPSYNPAPFHYYDQYGNDYSTDIYKVPKEDVVYWRITWTSATSFSFIAKFNLNSFIWPHQVLVPTRGLGSCSTWSLVAAQQLWLGLTCSAALGILVFQPRVELLSPALQGRFLTTGPPGKPPLLYFNEQTISCFIRANQYQISVFLSHVRCYRLNHHHHHPLYFGLSSKLSW